MKFSIDWKMKRNNKRVKSLVVSSTLNLLPLFLITLMSCQRHFDKVVYNNCDVDLRFELNRNHAIQFYDSTGIKTWKWENDSVDFIYVYFHVNTSIDDLVKIDSIIILNGGNENSSEGWELKYVKDNETVKRLEKSWMKLSNCESELNEWMLYGNYKAPFIPYIYECPDTNSTKTLFDPIDGWPEHNIRILKVQENWLKVDMTLKNEKYNGWMPSYSLCSHPHTTCNWLWF